MVNKKECSSATFVRDVRPATSICVGRYDHTITKFFPIDLLYEPAVGTKDEENSLSIFLAIYV